ncbi:TPR-like protein [Eremomyces bilateralis CBS 781.70]|uniref:TPR-like protein n=1 Tax=Eremomyces bilateralis CBS 781.70 TaxID=1392243 RepID=A0A6G1G1M3_9PEZI|nr:TPR-like protein [Eremomyces bilateralis CBS 781.70]KAF1811954.1 TPR-like protein [Eremomyces bilateralis CBS 781.70]
MSAFSQNGTANGVNGDHHAAGAFSRFSDIPPQIDVPVLEGDADEAVEVDLVELFDDPTELCNLLEIEKVAKGYWMTTSLAYAKQGKVDHAISILTQGLSVLAHIPQEEKLSLLNCLCWMYLFKCREAPRVQPESPDVKTKDFYIQAATSVLNDASRISPSYTPLFLARGVLSLLRASLYPPARGNATIDNTERGETLRQALKCFDDAVRASGGRNSMAIVGRARVSYSLGKFAEAFQGYQRVLELKPDLLDPDPRIGIGCCLWQLGHKDEAKDAWDRALELNPNSKYANILLGIYHLHSSTQFPTNDPQFVTIYKKAMTQYTQKAFKLDEKLPLMCSTFGGYFLMRKAMTQVERLARRAIELTDVNAIASDGWYLLARKEHYSDNVEKASEYYAKADSARGGEDRGLLAAKFGIAQMKVMLNDFDDAKFRLEKLIASTNSLEALTLYGALLAEDVFSTRSSLSEDEISSTRKKAIHLLEKVRIAWKDPKRKMSPDISVLLNLSRLYETDHPEKSLQCLQQVEQMQLDAIPEEERPQDIEDETERKSVLRELLPPQLLNNIGCFHYQSDKNSLARDFFQAALNACVKTSDKDAAVDTDALVTTISFNLARTYEAEGMPDEAKKVYEGLLERHEDYIDAKVRLTYLSLLQSPADEGPSKISELYHSAPNNLEVRSLYGWYLSRSKKRTMNVAEDQEQRHYKHTLQQFDKHDRYALTGMGNIYLTIAREMRRETDVEKEKRHKMYERAIEFFDKALQLDPRNSYAAQGIAIAMVEDKKDFATAVQIFTKVRETMKDASVFINLGHAFCELKQYSRAIENYDAALSKDRAKDPTILSCLGRVWLMKGKHDKSIQAMTTALDYSKRVLEIQPEQLHFRFNVAFVQIQIAYLIHSLKEHERSLEDVQMASAGLEEAIEAFASIAKAPNPPYPREEIEQRITMGRGTMRKQMDRALQSQEEYEEKNKAKLQAAREIREAEIQKREEAKRKIDEAAEEQRRRIAEERQRMIEQDRELALKRAEEDRKREEEEMTFDEDTGGKKKRTKKKAVGGKRKKKGEDSETDGEDSDGGRRRRSKKSVSGTPGLSDDEQPRRAKKRRLERRSANQKQYKSAELVVDSDDEDLEDEKDEQDGAEKASQPIDDEEDVAMGGESGDEAVGESSRNPRKKATRVIDDEDEEGEEEEPAARNGVTGATSDVPMDDGSPAGGIEDDEE